MSYHNSKKYDSTMSFQKSLNNIDTILMDVDKKYEVFQANNFIKGFVQLDENNYYNIQNIELINGTNSLIRDTLNSSAFIDSIYLYSFNSNYINALSKIKGVSSNTMEAFNDIHWFEEYNKNKQAKAILTTGINNSDIDFFTIMYEIRENENTIGILVFNINTISFMEYIGTNQRLENEIVFFTNSDNEVIFSNTDINEEYILNRDIKNDEIVVEKLAKNNLLCSSKLKNANLKFNIISEYYDMGFGIMAISLFLVMILLFAVILPTLFSFVLSNKLFNSIAVIVKNLQEIDNTDGATYQQNELEYIIFNIQQLAKNGKKLEKELALSISQLKQSQSIALQSQLNPHFLFNTLNSLTLLNKDKGAVNEFSLLVRNLSNLLSYALDYSGDAVTLENEIQYAKYYVKIEEIKYQTTINIEWNIAQDCYKCDVIRFLLQPIVENSIMHGFSRSFDKDKKIVVNAEKTDGDFCVTVTDNGVGMTAEKVNELNTMFREGYFPDSKHIGLCNLNKRIQLLYGDKYGCSVKSVENEETTVSILFPVRR